MIKEGKELNDVVCAAYRMGCEQTREVYQKRIEKLEAALREIATGYETEWSTSTMDNMLDVAQILSERINIARKTLEWEK